MSDCVWMSLPRHWWTPRPWLSRCATRWSGMEKGPVPINAVWLKQWNLSRPYFGTGLFGHLWPRVSSRIPCRNFLYLRANILCDFDYMWKSVKIVRRQPARIIGNAGVNLQIYVSSLTIPLKAGQPRLIIHHDADGYKRLPSNCRCVPIDHHSILAKVKQSFEVTKHKSRKGLQWRSLYEGTHKHNHTRFVQFSWCVRLEEKIWVLKANFFQWHQREEFAWIEVHERTHLK